jgi:hypothetical protein
VLAALLFAQFTFAPPVGNANGTAIAAIGGHILLVWSDHSAVYWERFDDTGAAIDSRPHAIQISIGPSDSYTDVAATASHNAFLIAWRDNEGVHATTLDANGAEASQPILITPRGKQPAVASDGNAFLIVWIVTTTENIFSLTVYGQLLHGDGTAGPSFFTDQAGNGVEAVIAQWTGDHYSVAFCHSFYSFWSDAELLFVSREGQPLNQMKIAANTSHLIYPPLIYGLAWDGVREVFLIQEMKSVGGAIFTNKPPTGIAYSIEPDGSLTQQALLRSGRAIVFDGHDFVIAQAPAVALNDSTVAIADRGFIHIAGTVRRRAAPTR